MSNQMDIKDIEQRPNCSFIATFNIQKWGGTLQKPLGEVHMRFECDGIEIFVAH